MKFGQLTKYSKKNVFLQNYAKIEAERLVPLAFLFFKKAFHEVKASCFQLSFNIFR